MPRRGIIVREDSYYVGAALDLLVQPFKRVYRVDLSAVFRRKSHARNDLLFTFVEDLHTLGKLSFQGDPNLPELGLGDF